MSRTKNPRSLKPLCCTLNSSLYPDPPLGIGPSIVRQETTEKAAEMPDPAGKTRMQVLEEEQAMLKQLYEEAFSRLARQKLEALDEGKDTATAEEAEKKRQAAAAAEKEAEKKRQAAAAAEEAEKKRLVEALAAAEAEKNRQAAAAAEAEKQRQAAAAAEEAERKRQAAAAEEAEKKRQAAAAAAEEEAEKKRQAAAAAEEAEKNRQAAAAAAAAAEKEAEKKRQAAAAASAEDAAKKKQAAAADAEKKRQADAEDEIRRMKQRLEELTGQTAPTLVTGNFKRAHSPLRPSTTSRSMDLSPLSKQLKQEHEEEERLKREVANAQKKAKLEEIQRKNELMRQKLQALQGENASTKTAAAPNPEASPASAAASPAPAAASPAPAASPTPTPPKAPSPSETASPTVPAKAAVATPPPDLHRSSPLEKSADDEEVPRSVYQNT